MSSSAVPVTHDTPKCLGCGAVVAWKVEPMLLPRHIVITLLLFLLFGAGLVYFLWCC